MLLEAPHCQMGTAGLFIFILLTDLFLLCWWPLGRNGAAAGGAELSVASCDLHNKMRISPMTPFCLLVAVMEWAPMGTASLKGLPWVIRHTKGLGIKCAVKLMRSIN